MQGIKGIKPQECLSGVVHVDLGLREGCRQSEGEKLCWLQAALLLPMCYL